MGFYGKTLDKCNSFQKDLVHGLIFFSRYTDLPRQVWATIVTKGRTSRSIGTNSFHITHIGYGDNCPFQRKMQLDVEVSTPAIMTWKHAASRSDLQAINLLTCNSRFSMNQLNVQVNEYCMMSVSIFGHESLQARHGSLSMVLSYTLHIAISKLIFEILTRQSLSG